MHDQQNTSPEKIMISVAAPETNLLGGMELYVCAPFTRKAILEVCTGVVTKNK